MNITKKQTPNYSLGRIGGKIDMIVVHIMDGNMTGTISWFASSTSQVSAHYGVGLDGSVVQWVDECNTAWANGRVDKPTSKIVKKRENVNPNTYTVSIENEGKDLAKAPECQLRTLAFLIRDIAVRNNIPLDKDHVVPHSAIYSKKPYCPSKDLSIMDKLIKMAKDTVEEMVTIEVKKSQVDRVREFIKSIR